MILLIVFVFSDCSSCVASDPFPSVPTDLTALLNSRYGEERETRKYSELSKSTQERKSRNERKTLWTFKMDPREEGKDRKTMWTFKMDPIPSESSVFNGAIFGPAIFLVILCTSINKDWKYKDKDKGAIVGPPIFLRLNYLDWKYWH